MKQIQIIETVKIIEFGQDMYNAGMNDEYSYSKWVKKFLDKEVVG